MNLGEKIYQLRSQKGLSQGNLADMLEVSRQSISKWENNTAVPELDKLIKLSEIFEISLDELVKEEKTIERNKEIVKPNISQAQKITGIILLAFSGLLVLFSLFFNGLIIGIIGSIPIIICGIICLNCRKNAGLWCFWVIFVIVSNYFIWTTGISWTSLIYYLKYAPQMGIQMIISAIFLLSLIILVGVTVSRFSKTQVTDYNKFKKQLIISIFAYCGLILLEFLFNMSSLHQSILDNIITRSWLLVLINTLFDFTRLIALNICLINVVKFIKYRKVNLK